jgi:hypothetical protein
MNHVEEALDIVVQKQSYVEETYTSVTDLLETCKRLRDGLDLLAGTNLPSLESTVFFSGILIDLGLAHAFVGQQTDNNT